MAAAVPALAPPIVSAKVRVWVVPPVNTGGVLDRSLSFTVTVTAAIGIPL